MKVNPFIFMNISGRLATGFSLMVAFVVAEGLWGLHYMHVLNTRIENMYQQELRAITVLDAVNTKIYEIQLSTLEHLRTNAASIMSELEKSIDEQSNAIIRLTKEYQQTRADPSAVEQKLMSSFDAHFDKYRTNIKQRVLPYSREGRKTEVHLLRNTTLKRDFQQTVEILTELISFNTFSAQTRNQYAINDYKKMRAVVISIIGVTIILSLLIAYYVSRSITRPLKRAVMLANRVASGDLTDNIYVHGKDEIGALLTSLKTMNEGLKKIVHNVKQSTDSISHATREIAAGNADLSHRVETQASSLTDTVTSLEELTSTAKQNSNNSQRANDLAGEATGNVKNGVVVMDDVVNTIGKINEGTKRINDILQLIDEIAFQTNILALNASVEAARAGEHGRGFTVVAGEVRELAQRSAVSAKEIKELIHTVGKDMDNGKELVTQARGSMDEIAHSIQRVCDIISEIANASAQQTATIEQINDAVAMVENNLQKDATMVEESAAASTALQQQVVHLESTIKVFKIGNHGQVNAAPSANTVDSKLTRDPKEEQRPTANIVRRSGPLLMAVKK